MKKRDESPVKLTRTRLPLDNGALPDIITFENLPNDDGRDHFALQFVNTENTNTVPLVRIHSECVTGDVLGSLRCDCGKQLDEAINRFMEHGGVLIYLRQEGRGIGLREKIKAYQLQDKGLNTYEANLALGHAEDSRNYKLAANMLHALGIDRIRLLTRNPEKAEAMKQEGIDVVEVIATALHRSDYNQRYLDTKEAKNTSRRTKNATPKRSDNEST